MHIFFFLENLKKNLVQVGSGYPKYRYLLLGLSQLLGRSQLARFSTLRVDTNQKLESCKFKGRSVEHKNIPHK